MALLAAAGSPDPARHARLLVAWGEGVMFDTIAGAGGAPRPTPEVAGLAAASRISRYAGLMPWP